MKIIVNGKIAGTKETGCALCGGKWGNYYGKINGEDLFFCCDICAAEFKNMLQELINRTGWKKVNEISIEGNYYTGRKCIAKENDKEYKFYVRFGENAEVTTFKEI